MSSSSRSQPGGRSSTTTATFRSASRNIPGRSSMACRRTFSKAARTPSLSRFPFFDDCIPNVGGMQGKAAEPPRPFPGAYLADGVLHHLVRHLLRLHAVSHLLHLPLEEVDPFLTGRLLSRRTRPVPPFPA